MSLAVPIILTVIIVCAGIFAAIPILGLMRAVADSQRREQELAQRRLAPQRTAMHPAGPPHSGVCPICGMDDPDRLESRWRTWPAHTDCLEWLMPGGPSLVDEYANPALSDSPKRGSIRSGVTTAEAGAAIAAVFSLQQQARDPIDVTTMGDPAPVYLESRKI